METSRTDFETLTENLKGVRRITWIGLWMNVGLTGLKFLAGWFGHSSVLIADATHSFSDLATDVMILIGSRFWGRPADRDHPYTDMRRLKRWSRCLSALPWFWWHLD